MGDIITDDRSGLENNFDVQVSEDSHAIAIAVAGCHEKSGVLGKQRKAFGSRNGEPISMRDNNLRSHRGTRAFGGV